MLLKRIELEGFKSFADRTVIPVERGLTGIVGPNGCGKSNVVDALLWVMGERSAKALRADSMDDVIFKGAEGRPGGAYAMVEVILTDPEGQVVEAGGEVAVGRRLFRTGESEYLLHGRRVKRKEVRDLLMDTGLGVRGYMVLAQGKIDAVLSADPSARRLVFEEAAGISRYKARKHETRLKLKAVAQDLARVEDVLEEVQKAVRSLRYQAGKAQRFLEMRDDYRRKRVHHSFAETASLREAESAQRGGVDALERAIGELRSGRETGERQLRALQDEEEAFRTRHDRLRGEAAVAKEQVAALEERVHGLEERAAELDHRRELEAQRLAELDEEAGQHRAAAEILLQEREGLIAERDAVAARLAEVERGFEDAREARHRIREEAEALRKTVLDALAERTRFHNESAQAAHRRSEAEGALRALERRRSERAVETERLQELRKTAQAELEEASGRVDEAEGQARSLVERRDGLMAQAEESAHRAAEARRRGAEARTRLEALASIEEEQAGLPDQVRKLLDRTRDGVKSLLLEGVEIAAPWDRLLENLLGRMQHALWLASREEGVELGEAGIDCFFPPESGPAPVHVADARPLRTVLHGDDARCDALCARLGEVYCTETSARARELAVRHPGALFLSREGELHGRGYARLGMLQEESAAGILARRNARESAQAVLAESGQEAELAERSAAEARAELEQVKGELSHLDGRLREALSLRDRAQARVQDLDLRLAAGQEESRALEAEAGQLRQEVQDAQRQEQAAERARAEAETKRLSTNSRLSELEGSVAEREDGFESARAAVQEARMNRQRFEQRLQHLTERAEADERVAERQAQECQRVRQELEQLAARAKELREEADRGRTESRHLLETRAGLEERLGEAAAQMQRVAEGLARQRQAVEGSAGKLEELLGQRQEQALELQRVQLQREELTRAIHEEFQQPLEDLVRSLGLTPESARMEREEQEALSSEVVELKRKLDQIGAVNLDAVQELEEREQRSEFLAREREDLLAAQANLERTLEDLDGRCRERFLATFEAVQDQFEAIFRRLFRGGRASLSLEDEADPLDAGIDISVRPPGKELRSIKLLSGGERTLTALALLLAVFRSRPSPFCLLDEVDAALDDANVGRFLDVLHDFVGDTQFMVVTHNRITMGRCERLFGVTMRKAGVSLVVSVDLQELPESPQLRLDGPGVAERPDMITTKQERLPIQRGSEASPSEREAVAEN